MQTITNRVSPSRTNLTSRHITCANSFPRNRAKTMVISAVILPLKGPPQSSPSANSPIDCISSKGIGVFDLVAYYILVARIKRFGRFPDFAKSAFPHTRCILRKAEIPPLERWARIYQLPWFHTEPSRSNPHPGLPLVGSTRGHFLSNVGMSPTSPRIENNALASPHSTLTLTRCTFPARHLIYRFL